MKGFGFREHGDLDRLEFVEIPEPRPGPGEVRIGVRAAAFNRLDRFTLQGIPGVVIDRPHVLGSDACGVVDSVGPGVDDLAPGAKVLVNPGIADRTCDACRAGHQSLCRNYRILGEHTQGSTTEFIVMGRENVHPLPSRLDFITGAAAPLVFQTAWRALATVGEVGPGSTVAIVGAGGGVTTAAIQIAKLLGGTVAVAARSKEKAERTLALGADAALAFDAEHPLDKVLWQWSGKRGVDVIFDSVGAPTLGRSVRALSRGGRVVVIGATAGALVELDVRTLFWRQASIRGSTMSDDSEFEQVLAHLASGKLRPVVDSVHPFAEAIQAFRRFDGSDLFGKVVVTGPRP